MITHLLKRLIYKHFISLLLGLLSFGLPSNKTKQRAHAIEGNSKIAYVTIYALYNEALLVYLVLTFNHRQEWKRIKRRYTRSKSASISFVNLKGGYTSSLGVCHTQATECCVGLQLYCLHALAADGITRWFMRSLSR